MRYTVEDFNGTFRESLAPHAAALPVVAGLLAAAHWVGPASLRGLCGDAAWWAALAAAAVLVLWRFGDGWVLGYLNSLGDFGAGSDAGNDVVLAALGPVETAIQAGATADVVGAALRAGLRQAVIDGVEWRNPTTLTAINRWLEHQLTDALGPRAAARDLPLVWAQVPR